MKKYNSPLEERQNLERKLEIGHDVYNISLAFLWGCIIKEFSSKANVTLEDVIDNKDNLKYFIPDAIPVVTAGFAGIISSINNLKNRRKLNKLFKQNSFLIESKNWINSMTYEELKLMKTVYDDYKEANKITGFLDYINERGLDDFYEKTNLGMGLTISPGEMDCSVEILDLNKDKYYDASEEELNLKIASEKYILH